MSNFSSIKTIGQGPPVVFLHGFPLDRRLWELQIEPLSDRYRIVLVDIAGFGTALPITAKQFTSIAAFASDIIEALSQANIATPYTIVGLSMGGYIALEMWAQAAERIKSLVLCHTKATADDDATKAKRKTNATTAIEQGTKVIAAPMLDILFSQQSLIEDKSLKPWLQEMMFAVPPATIQTALLAMAARRDFTDILPEINVPTLVIAGTDDEIATTETMQRMARQMPNAKFHGIHDAGHLSPRERPEEFNKLLVDFLDA